MAVCKYAKFIPQLTRRELEVIETVLAGAFRYKSIATSLNISVNTVKTHLRKIYLTVGVNNIEALAFLFYGYSQNKTYITPKSPQKNTKSPQIGDRKQRIFAVILFNMMRSGGKKVQNLKAIRIISLFLVLTLTIGFVTVKLVSGNWQNNMGFGMTAETVPEGILLSFSNIPSDTIRLFISVNSFDEIEETKNGYNIFSSFADIRDTSFPGGGIYSLQLETIKEAGKIIFPMVQAGQKYNVSAMLQTKSDIDNGIISTFFEVETIAENGIYFNRNDIELGLNINNSAVTLYTEPSFSSDLNFYNQKYGFGVTIMVKENGSIGLDTHHIPEGLSADGLTWTFEPIMTKNFANDNRGWLEKGNYYPTWISAYVNFIHDDIIWFSEIAKTPVFDYSL
jgi:DNA-binding CsgD family transcriptional regulator